MAPIFSRVSLLRQRNDEHMVTVPLLTELSAENEAHQLEIAVNKLQQVSTRNEQAGKCQKSQQLTLNST